MSKWIRLLWFPYMERSVNTWLPSIPSISIEVGQSANNHFKVEIIRRDPATPRRFGFVRILKAAGLRNPRLTHVQIVNKARVLQKLGWCNYRNVRRDVTAWTGWQRSHNCHSLLTRQKRCFYKGRSLTWAHIFVVHSNIRNLPGYFKRGNISLPDNISQMKIYLQIKEKL